MKKIVRKAFYRLINPTYSYSPKEGIDSLLLKMNLYFSLHEKERLRYLPEITHINKIKDNDNSLSLVFPYTFSESFNSNDIVVYQDLLKELYYVLHNGKRLYFPKSYITEDQVKVNYVCTLTEQNASSPHLYLNDEFKVSEGDVVVDIGAAEGNFALDVVEEAAEVYIFEPDPKWTEALYATFEPWKDKVTIITKYVSDSDSETSVTLDQLFMGKTVNLIKIDAEGAELCILKKSLNLLKNNSHLKLLVCTYHKQNDALAISRFFSDLSFNFSFAKGYMLFIHEKLSPPYFRNGLIRAIKG